MGTEITLDIEGVTLTYSKNHFGIDHGALFQDADRCSLPSDEIDHDADEEDESRRRMGMTFSRLLGKIVCRLELLGFDLDRVRREYERSCSEALEAYRDPEEDSVPDLMTFEEFLAFATEHPLRSLDRTFLFERLGDRDSPIRGRFVDGTTLRRVPHFSPWDSSAYSEASFFSELVDILHPYALLRLLGENAENLLSDVVWQYGPLVENGYVDEREFVPNARRTDTFLVATEGTSDVHILRHAFLLLRPEVIDFFRFIDVSNGHPFSGAGNLLKFAEGLAKIDVHNQVVFLFDNDAEGRDAFIKLSALALPGNMRGMVLPTREEFRDFPARGPDGVRNFDINGRAAAIECYLDLNLPNRPPPQVTWTNFKRELDTYQGALDFKETYTRAFLKQAADTVSATGYEMTRIEAVLDALIAECTAIASSRGVTLPAPGPLARTPPD